jgi:hypothetical protein
MLFPALICLFLPGTIATSYTKIMHPLALLIGGLLSLRVASIYKNWLRKMFIFLSLFLILYMLPFIDPFSEVLRAVFGNFYLLFVLILMWTTYAMLVICSLYILKVTEVRKISRKRWVIIVAMSFIGVIILAYHIPPLFQSQNYPEAYKITLTLIYALDVVIAIMLMPVVLLYSQQMQLEGRESITFATIVCGIILLTIADYIYVIISGKSLFEVAHALHQGSILDALYLFSILIIAVGLYVHKEYDDWGFDMIEQALSGG